jgi:KipI family sensor histidine kinase inhibitor
MGDAGLLVEVDGLDEVLALDDALRAARPSGVLDVVPAARTVLLVLEPGTDLAATRRAVRELAPAGPPAAGAAAPDPGVETPAVEIVVRYDGPDLEEVGRLTGLGAEGVVAAHTGSPWRVAFGGFAPGFAYLAGGDARLTVARRAEPRTTVPAGAVGLAGEFSGIYPRPSPGGWQLIGSTDARLWSDTDGALLRPGGAVRFRVAR